MSPFPLHGWKHRIFVSLRSENNCLVVCLTQCLRDRRFKSFSTLNFETPNDPTQQIMNCCLFYYCLILTHHLLEFYWGKWKQIWAPFSIFPETSQSCWENPGLARRRVMQQLYEDASQCKSNAHNVSEIITLINLF